MTIVQRSATILAVILIAAPSAFAQTASPTPTTKDSSPQIQPTNSAKPADAVKPGAGDASVTAKKQQTDGGDSPSDPRATDATAAAWRKLHPSDP
jgi:hypothetical protein